MKKTLFLTIGVLTLIVAGGLYSNNVEFATCTGSKNCKACKNCKYCKHCSKNGNSCGVCKK